MLPTYLPSSHRDIESDVIFDINNDIFVNKSWEGSYFGKFNRYTFESERHTKTTDQLTKEKR